MFFKKLTSVIVIFTLLLAASCGKASPNTELDSTTASETTVVPSPEEQRLQAMTVEQKVAQLLVAGISGTTPGEDGIAAIQNYQVGGIILFGRNVSSSRQLTELTNQLKALNTDYIPLFLCVDEEGGRAGTCRCAILRWSLLCRRSRRRKGFKQSDRIFEEGSGPRF